MRFQYSKNTLSIRGIRRSQVSVLGGWQDAISLYLPWVSFMVLYGPVTNQFKTSAKQWKKA